MSRLLAVHPRADDEVSECTPRILSCGSIDNAFPREMGARAAQIGLARMLALGCHLILAGRLRRDNGNAPKYDCILFERGD